MNIGAHTTESLCVYFEDSGDTLKQFELMLDKLDTEHPKIKSMRINFEELRKLIAKGKRKNVFRNDRLVNFTRRLQARIRLNQKIFVIRLKFMQKH